MIVVQGGPNTIKTAREAVYEDSTEDRAFPVVLVQGSGGAADILARAITCTYDPKGNAANENFERDVRKQFEKLSVAKQDEIIKYIWDCVKKKDMASIMFFICNVFLSLIYTCI